MPFVEMRNISKRFGPVLANNNVSIDVRRGEILSLLGENGSGKSTLVNMLSGIYTPDAGIILIDGRQQHFRSPRDAISAGIGMVHQHFMLIPVMTALENISIGEKTCAVSVSSIFIDRKKISQKINAIKERFGLSIENDKKIYDMSVGEKQTVEIIKMLYHGAQTLILDEPSAVLTPQETESLFAVLRNMRGEGCAVIIITHKLAEVMEISDRVTVLRKGEAIGTVATTETSPEALTEMMVGGSISLEIKRDTPHCTLPPILEIRDLTVEARHGSGGGKLLDRVGFELCGGEILGLAGIAGSGQKELAEAICGLVRPSSGSIHFAGENIIGLSPLAIRRRGVELSFVPEDRLGMGLAAGMSITDNILLKSFNNTPGLFVDRSAGRTAAQGIVDRYAISTPSIAHVVKKLSGGNIQKVLLGREIERSPRLLITAYPARGLDIGASLFVYEMLNKQKAAGVAILFIGEDLDVLLQLCDRIMVFHAGVLMDTVNARESDKNRLGALMLGQREAA